MQTYRNKSTGTCVQCAYAQTSIHERRKWSRSTPHRHAHMDNFLVEPNLHAEIRNAGLFEGKRTPTHLARTINIRQRNKNNITCTAALLMAMAKACTQMETPIFVQISEHMQ